MKTLRQHREGQGLSVRALADKAGVSTRTIVQAEAVRQDAYPATMRKLSAALGVTPLDVTEFAASVGYVSPEHATDAAPEGNDAG